MQGYMYSVFSSIALVVHLIINFDLLIGRRAVPAHGARYRGFALGVLAYYVTDMAWGILAGLGWNRLLYVDTVFFFLSLVAFVFMWCRFVESYLGLGKRTVRFLTGCGYALLTINIAALMANPFNNCFFHIDSNGIYQVGFLRDPAFYLLVAFSVLIAIFVFIKAISEQGAVHRRGMMVFLCGITMAVAMGLQIIWPLTPFTSLGCLFSICFFHVFVVQDAQAANHMAELKNALDRALAAEKAKSMFFSIVSHDIRTPLNAILGYSALLKSGIKNEKERDEALDSISASGTTLLQLVNDVLDLAKLDSGKMTLHLEPVNLAQLTDNVFSSFRLTAREKGIELVNRAADVPTVMLDEHRFRQILFNLVGNAVKFTEHGSVIVAASYADTNLEVSVSDTGCGIPSDMLIHILEPFVQVRDPSHSADRSSGTGLGLPICNRLTETMGGKLIVESELGKGSKFRVCIPGVATNETKAVTVGEQTSTDVQREIPKHVLVVDDSPVNRKVLTAFLKKAGVVSIGTASDGGVALSELDSALKNGSPYDFVFSDLWMPNVNGMEFIEKLRADSRFSQLPVYALTADTEFRSDARTDLFTGVLLKPVTYEKLVDVFAAVETMR